MTVVKGFRLTEISKWAQQHLQSGSLVVSDGLACFAAVKDAGCLHDSIVSGGGHQSVTKEEFTWVNTMTGNVKNAITGTYHAIKPLEKLSLVMRKIKGKSAKELNEFLGRKGTFWLKDYDDKGIRDERHFGVVYRYIRNNPLKLREKDREGGFYGFFG